MAIHRQGFSLIELLIVVSVLAIVLALGVPGYRQYLIRANRSDATAALLRIAAAQERYYLQNGRYATTRQELEAAPPDGLGTGKTERDFYVLELAPNGGGPATGFIASATVRLGGAQSDDEECRVFMLDERGQHTAFDRFGDSNERCWR